MAGYVESFVGDVAIAAATFGANVTQDTVRWWHNIASIATRWVQFLLSNTIVTIIIVAIMVVSAAWFPYHHVALSGGQVCWSCTAHPLMDQIINPIVDKLAIPAQTVMRFINVWSMLPRKFTGDLATLPLKCSGTVELIKSVQRAIPPFARFTVGTVRIALNATLARPAGIASQVAGRAPTGTASRPDHTASGTSISTRKRFRGRPPSST